MRSFIQKTKKTIFFYQVIIAEPSKGWSNLELSDIPGILQKALSLLMALIGGCALLILVYGGVQYLTAYGNEEKAQKAKATILWAIVGVVVALLAWVLVDQVWWLVTGGRSPVRPATSPGPS